VSRVGLEPDGASWAFELEFVDTAEGLPGLVDGRSARPVIPAGQVDERVAAARDRRGQRVLDPHG
jgi:hypothetical protein